MGTSNGNGTGAGERDLRFHGVRCLLPIVPFTVTQYRYLSVLGPQTCQSYFFFSSTFPLNVRTVTDACPEPTVKRHSPLAGAGGMPWNSVLSWPA